MTESHSIFPSISHQVEDHYSPASTPNRIQKQLPILEHEKVLPAETKERTAWYAYDWANGAFFYSAMNFLPLMITGQARHVAMGQYCKWNETCIDTTFGWAEDYYNKGGCSNRNYDDNQIGCVSNNATWTANLKDSAKSLDVGGLTVGYASFAPYCVTVSVVLQLFLFITMGSFADFGPNRKNMMIFFNTVGIVAMLAAFFTGDDDLYWLNGLLWIVAIVCFTFSTVFYNAFLPLLAAAHPDILHAKAKGLMHDEVVTMEKETTHRMSIKGLASGFIGQLIFLIGAFVVMFFVTDEGYLNSRLTIGLGGVWMIIFTSFTFVFLNTRPGPPLPPGESYCKHSVQAAYKTFKTFFQLRELGKFLMAYFMFSDGTTTVAQASIVFAQEELKMDTLAIAIGLVEVSICAAAGCILFKWLHEKRGIHAKTIVIINLSIMALIPIWAMIYMRTPLEFYGAILLFGINTGSQQAFTHKGSAWLGPLVIALVNQATGSYRDAFSTLVIFFVIGIALLMFFKPSVAEVQKQEFDRMARERSSQSSHAC